MSENEIDKQKVIFQMTNDFDSSYLEWLKII